MTATRSQVCSTSDRTCETSSTVFPFAFWPGDHFPQQCPADQVEALGRLVEHQQVGVVEQRLGQAEPLDHALAEPRDRLVGAVGQADELEQLVARGPESSPA